MTMPEYYQWATGINLKAKEALPKVYAPKWLDGTETDTGSTVETYGDLGGYNNYGCGCGSYRGQGGYLGYGLSLINTQSVTFPRRWLNPDYIGPGPLVIVNPYVNPNSYQRKIGKNNETA
jgi:hypothetical protein